MKFVEVDVLGVYVAPIAVMLLVAWIITIILCRIADRFSLLRYVWHPPLFVGAVYLIVLSSIVLFAAR
ncbi:DUF1656 domain-containing protein [Methylovirgula sp. 4M-Z18]|uniref:DUF1656 domain-containing protein n=1 Tax=Methylovirgula sp. 4M-Z18 TaxID=2293567 RepID=UPI000E2FE479|nr:DUF1656 domain-containing protein [Methylovirgula sp. 4M-Z18]RFB80925.1 DUF1656 domain-containing protein [Methylovirgula sp. 4M-Z18]